MIELLHNYRLLVHKVDQFCQQTATKYAAHIVCSPGCDNCCRHLSLFPVEAFAVASALQEAAAPERAVLRRGASEADLQGTCPLLLDKKCGLYKARPLICRTHGLPLVTAIEGNRRVDCCPLNFQGLDSLPGDSVLDLDRLNETLVAVNALFVSNCTGRAFPERLTMAESLLLFG